MSMRQTSFLSLPPQDQSLLLEAEKVMYFAYSPYSQFCVGAALLAEDGSIHVGTNMENATYTCVVHAEASALSAANNKGIRSFAVLAVIGGSRSGVSLEPVMPCGICRQNLYEFAQFGKNDLKILCSNTNKDKIIITSLSELLPSAFGPKSLEG